ncbi:mCG59384 [Mus musculus]|nr:mCG59384 [Mus musculus]
MTLNQSQRKITLPKNTDEEPNQIKLS